MPVFPTRGLRHRLVASGFHLLASAALAGGVALLIFSWWFPPPFDAVAGGRSLFLLIVGVDIVLGPALTFVAAAPGKSAREFGIDLALIVAFQLTAFAYGSFTIAQARPVLISFEVDRFRVVTTADIEPDELAKAPPQFRSLSWSGPLMLAAVNPSDPNEQLKSIDLGLAGIDLSMLPSNWRTYESLHDVAWAKARPASLILDKFPQSDALMRCIAQAAGHEVRDLRFLPLVSRQVSWLAIMAPPDARIVGYLPVDGFF